jgi:hypothetical protein
VQVSNETLVKVSTAPFTATLNVSTVLTTPTGIYAVVIQMQGGTSQPFIQHTALVSITVT